MRRSLSPSPAGLLASQSSAGFLRASFRPHRPPCLTFRSTGISSRPRDAAEDLHADKRIWQGALITSWFWLVGAAVLALLQNLIPQVLTAHHRSTPLRSSRLRSPLPSDRSWPPVPATKRPNLALVPIGALLMGLFLLDLAWPIFSHEAGARTADRGRRRDLH